MLSMGISTGVRRPQWGGQEHAAEAGHGAGDAYQRPGGPWRAPHRAQLLPTEPGAYLTPR